MTETDNNITLDLLDGIVSTINNIKDLGIIAAQDYADETESLGVYSMAGGQVTNMFYDGRKEKTVLYQVAISTKRQIVANKVLFEIDKALSHASIQSSNGSYELNEIVPQPPKMEGRTEDGWYLFTMDITATIITE